MLPLGETTFLGRIVDILRQVPVRSIRVVVPGAFERPDMPVRWVVNPESDSEQLASLQCALRDLPADSDALLVWAVDHPLVREDTLRALLEAFDGRMVQPFDGRPGHPVIFSRAMYGELLSASPAAGARSVVRHSERRLVPVEDPGIHVNVDTPADYQAAQEGLQRPSK
jgi:CTP:molybdopterin cytidylyltransferase MocA